MTMLAYHTVHAQYLMTPKCAGTSILTRMYRLDALPVEEVHREAHKHLKPWRPKGPPTFAVVRHPWRRFVSTWKNKVHSPHSHDTRLLKLGAPKGCDIDTFCKFVLAMDDQERENEVHLRPQHMYLPEDRDGINVMVFEDLPVCWKRAGYQQLWGGLPMRNHTRHVDAPTSSRFRRHIEYMYRKDMSLWLDVFGDLDEA